MMQNNKHDFNLLMTKAFLKHCSPEVYSRQLVHEILIVADTMDRVFYVRWSFLLSISTFCRTLNTLLHKALEVLLSPAAAIYFGVK